MLAVHCKVQFVSCIKTRRRKIKRFKSMANFQAGPWQAGKIQAPTGVIELTNKRNITML